MTAICATGSPTIYAWTGGNCTGLATQSCAAVDTNVTRNYSVVISNAIGPGQPNPATKSVVWSASVPVKPSGCSISADVNPLPAGGGTVHLTANCTGGDPVDTWNWSGTSSSTGNTGTASITASTAFSVTATNGGGNGTASLTVNVGGGGGGGPISCSGFLNTNVLVLGMPIDSNRTLNMGVLDAGVVQFTPSAGNTTGQIILSTAGNNAATHHDFVLSSQPCDFVGIKAFVNAGAPTIRFTISPTGGSGTNLKAGQTYYINVRNNVDSGCATTNDTCNLYPVSSKP